MTLGATSLDKNQNKASIRLHLQRLISLNRCQHGQSYVSYNETSTGTSPLGCPMYAFLQNLPSNSFKSLNITAKGV